MNASETGGGGAREGATRRVRVAAGQLAARNVDQAADANADSHQAIRTAAAQGAELIVLPECTWPGYVIGARWRGLWGQLAPQDEVLAGYGDLAGELGIVVVVGLALRDGDELANVAVVFDRDGSEAGRTSKRFLWDFDTRCFQPGQQSPVIDTAVGRLGVIVCADGRMPEIARTLALAGAELLLDPTAWVTTQPDPATWSNPQFEFMFRTRAWENGLPAVAANKVGVERDAVAYCGRSCVLDRDGTLVASAPPDAPAVLVEDCELGSPALPVTRRPGLYAALARPGGDLPVSAAVRQSLVPSEATGRVAVAALDRPLADSDLDLVDDLGAALLIDPLGSAPSTPVPTITSWDTERAVMTVDGREVARWARTHGSLPPGDALGPLVDTAAGRVGVLLGADGLLPEPARVLMLEGAELLVWFAPDHRVAAVAATRAAENRVNLALAARLGAATATAILDPDGRTVAAVGPHPRIVHAVVSVAEARRKEMAPGTDVVSGRQPRGYGSLVDDADSVPLA